MPADHSAEEQKDQYPTNELKLDHWYIPYCDHAFSVGRVGISRHSTSRKWTST
jgi:hypothetical protein